MTSLSIMGVFCEDIRVEVGNISTLVGVLPHNANLVPASGKTKRNDSIEEPSGKLLTKLCVYARATFSPDDPVETIKIKLRYPNGRSVQLGISPDVMSRAREQAIKKGHPLAGVNIRSMFQPNPTGETGIMKLEAEIDGESRLLAFVKFSSAEHEVSDGADRSH